ncbi:Uncharacterised protein [Bordetella pertussis]|nr:Uncharacterised protein [Bordetella pertussis]
MPAQVIEQGRVGGLRQLHDAVGLQFGVQHVDLPDFSLAVAADAETLALQVHHQPAPLEQAQGLANRAAAGAEALFEVLFT